MPNAWVIHVKDFAQRNGISYGCALSMPECKEEYYKTPKEPDYTKQIQKVGDLMRSKQRLQATQAFNELIPKIKALGDGEARDNQMRLMSALKRAIQKLQSVSE